MGGGMREVRIAPPWLAPPSLAALSLAPLPLDGPPPAQLDRPVAPPLAWTAAGLTPEDGLLRLTPGCRAELERAVALVRANPLPLLLLDPDELELAECRALMAEAKRILDAGVGFVVIDRLPLD